jgi:hypothetical protein
MSISPETVFVPAPSDPEEQRLEYLIEQLDCCNDPDEKQALFADIYQIMNGGPHHD